jgi:hypothetical protein
METKLGKKVKTVKLALKKQTLKLVKMATGAEKVLKWMNEFYAQNGTPNFGEIVAQLEMAIAEEKGESSSKDEEIRAEISKMPQQARSILHWYLKFNSDCPSSPSIDEIISIDLEEVKRIRGCGVKIVALISDLVEKAKIIKAQ